MNDSWYEATNNPARLFTKMIPSGDEPKALREIADFLEANDQFTFLSFANSGSSIVPDQDHVELILLEDVS